MGHRGENRGRREFPFGNVASVDMFVVQETTVELRSFRVGVFPSLTSEFMGIVGPDRGATVFSAKEVSMSCVVGVIEGFEAFADGS